MYAHCVFCTADLGTNEAIEAFPVGRRLAYDPQKGRLWVVCGACRRWNLTPLEERWEAIEEAERLYRGTRLRASTDHVGLARVADGVDLIRIGKPLLPEFAAWRYGSQLTERRRRYAFRSVPAAAIGGVGIAATLGAYAAVGSVDAVATLGSYVFEPAIALPTGFVGTIAAFAVGNAVAGVFGRAELATRHALTGSPATIAGRIGVRPEVAAGSRLVVRRGHLAESTLDADANGSLVLDLRHEGGRIRLRDRDARRAASALAPSLNPGGANDRVVGEAVHSIAVRGGSEQYLTRIGRWIGKSTRPMVTPPSKWSSDMVPPEAGLYALSATQRLALEVALHEDAERRAMDGALAELERAWRDAEEIAAIADGLALPPGVESAWERLRARVRR